MPIFSADPHTAKPPCAVQSPCLVGSLGARSLGAVSAIALMLFAGTAATAQDAVDANGASIAETSASPPSPPGQSASTTDAPPTTGPRAPSEAPANADVPIGTEIPFEELERIKNEIANRPASGEAAPGDAEQQMDTGGDAGAGSAAPAPLTNFAGIPDTGWFPPDPIMAVGPSDMIVSVNSSWRIYSKTGTQIFERSLTDWFANVLPANRTGISVFDPWVLYDQVGGRFILLALAKRDSDQFSQFLIAVSDNATAAGRWCNYSLNARVNGATNTNNWADYTKVGVTNNAVVLSANMFNFPTIFTPQGFQYAKLRFIPKSTLYSASCPGQTWRDFWDLRNADNSRAFTIQPAHSYFLSSTSYGINSTSGGGNRLTLWRYTTTATSPPGVTLARQASLPTATYSLAPNAEQRDSATRIHSGDARLLNAVHHGSGLWTAHTVGCTWVGDPLTRSCIRWYQINPFTNTILQQRSYGAPRSHYFYPAIVGNISGNATVVFNRSGPSEYAGVRYTGRRSTDPLNTLQGSSPLRNGEDCYTDIDSSGRNRFGDYSGIALDPSFGNRAWVYGEYAFGVTAGCTGAWRTQIGQVTW